LRLHLKQYIFVTLIVIFLIATGYAGKQIGYERIITLLKEHQLLGMAVYIGYTVLSTVIITLPIVPVWPVALLLYGFWTAVFLSLVGILVGASISFLLARHFGRPLVIKMMGKKVFTEIEHLIHVNNTKTFLLIRLFGNNYFDAVSYIAGLSKLTFRTYIVITSVSSFIWIIFMMVIIQKIGGLENIKSFLTMMGIYGAVILIGTVLWEIFHKHHKLKRKKRS